MTWELKVLLAEIAGEISDDFVFFADSCAEAACDSARAVAIVNRIALIMVSGLSSQINRGSVVVAVDDRVSDRTFGDDADNVHGPWPMNAPEYNSGAGAMAFQSGKHETEKIDVPANYRAVFDKPFNEQVRIAPGLAP